MRMRSNACAKSKLRGKKNYEGHGTRARLLQQAYKQAKKKQSKGVNFSLFCTKGTALSCLSSKSRPSNELFFFSF
jgi:hypothetical protein